MIAVVVTCKLLQRVRTCSECNRALVQAIKWFDNHTIEGRQKIVITNICNAYMYLYTWSNLTIIVLIIAIKPHKSVQTTLFPVCGDHARV